jgi:zinc transport system ATP-binding protein
MTNTNVAIEANNLSFAYNGTVVLEHLTFSIEPGAYVGIIGPNGGGKTTLMKLILGLLEPKEGNLKVLGQSPKVARARGHIGYVPQRVAQGDAAFPATVEEVVRSGRSAYRGMLRWMNVEDRRAIEEAMERTDILPFRKRLIGSLSGGERQRVFIARALASQPKMLVLDEPTTGIDPAARESFYALLQKLNKKQHIGILFVSHDLEVMTKEATSLLCINKVIVCDCESCKTLSPGVIEELYGKNVSLVHHTH